MSLTSLGKRGQTVRSLLMSRRWIYFLAGALLVLGGYWGFLGSSEKSGEAGGADHPTRGPASEPAVFDSGSHGSWEAEPLERLRLPDVSGSEARKRDGTLFVEEELEEIVYQALNAGDPEERAFAVGELSTWEPTRRFWRSVLKLSATRRKRCVWRLPSLWRCSRILPPSQSCSG